MAKLEDLRQTLDSLKDTPDQSVIRGALVRAARDIPKTAENLALLRLGFELLSSIENPHERRLATIDFVKELPNDGVFREFYSSAMEAAIFAADELDDDFQHRITELVRIASELPKTAEFVSLRRLAWRLAMNLPDRPKFRQVPLEKFAKDLPKMSDYEFYRRYTLMGIAQEVLKEGAFPDIYREAIETAINAAAVIEEPYLRKYSLMYIAHELPKTAEYAHLYHQLIEDSCKAALESSDPFARQYAILELIGEIPKAYEFYPLLKEMIEQGLAFFTVKKWMEDVEVFDVVDYILSAEESGINDTKKKRYSRERYANMLTKELNNLVPALNDVRFTEMLRPYTHVWVQPRTLRDAVKKLVDHLDGLSRAFHGKEIERPVFVREAHPDGLDHYVHKKDPSVNECIAIDLGATNTVIMKKKGDGPPEFINLPAISRQYDGRVPIIPTVLGSETNTIGADVLEDNPLIEIKQALLEGSPRGREQMERFFRVLYQHLKKATSTSAWFALVSKNTADILYITVPVGYLDYRNALRDIVQKTVKTRAEFIEEPLAAAIGYQVVEDRDKVVMIIDFGGSTLNTMVVRVNRNEVHVVSKPERAQMLGGHDIDIWLAEHLAKKAGVPEGSLPYSLVLAAEEIKIALSERAEAPFEWDGRAVCTVTREELEEVLDKHDFYRFVDRTMSYVLRRAEKVGLKKDRIEAVLLTGGSSQIPSFKEKIADLFPNLRKKNLIFDHSPLTAVAIGAAQYGTRDVTDRHLGMAYALRYAPDGKDTAHSYSILLEKGELLPLEKTFRITPAKKLSEQSEIYLELFEVPESLITRRWATEGGIEFLKQELKKTTGITLAPFKTLTISFKEPIREGLEVSFMIDGSGRLSVKYGVENTVMETDVRLQ